MADINLNGTAATCDGTTASTQPTDRFNGVVKGANSRPLSFTLAGATCTTE
ncbi:hypothetical protein [Lentzea cavernae]|uniref:hypothetical protein n=1 Tax=Lentzea cavernae TaxID=2020703 RepID=UPI00174A9CF7|nr:hypothetical protein [Lentzea cavernae]